MRLNARGWSAYNLCAQTVPSVTDFISSAEQVADHTVPTILGYIRKGDPAALVAVAVVVAEPAKELFWHRNHCEIENMSTTVRVGPAPLETPAPQVSH